MMKIELTRGLYKGPSHVKYGQVWWGLSLFLLFLLLLLYTYPSSLHQAVLTGRDTNTNQKTQRNTLPIPALFLELLPEISMFPWFAAVRKH